MTGPILMPVARMVPGDRFLTNRSGVVTVVGTPARDDAWSPSYSVDVRREDGHVFRLVGLHLYHVTREEVSA